MRIRLVVFEKHIESRLVLLYEVRFEYQGLDLVIDDDELKISDQLYQLACLGVVIAARLKIRTHTVAEVFRLAHVDYSSGVILVNVNPGPRR